MKQCTCQHMQKSTFPREQVLRNYYKIVHGDSKQMERAELCVLTSYATDDDENAPFLPDVIPHSCLHCSFIGALHAAKPSKDGFIKHSFQTDHFLALHLLSDTIYCALCRDYVYDDDFRSEHPVLSLNSKRKRDQWLCTVGKRHLKNLSSTTLDPDVAVSSLSLVRGLYNMGNTCFMSCILQAVVHNPMIRNFFLADKHNSSICKKRRDTFCLACDMDRFFTQMFRPGSGLVPFVPHDLLYSMWQHAMHLAGYEQQDAHEFLMGLLDGIHSSTHCNVLQGGSSPRIGHKGTSLCNCVVHETFSGVLRSDVTCAQCGSVSSAYDPFFDLSLSMDKMEGDQLSIKSFLDKFTHKEHLTQDEQAKCEKCGTHQDCFKQLLIHRIPNVLCIHLKRFDALTRKKISKMVRFSAHGLDLSPYMTSRPATTVLYDLFAVVNHHGTLSSGHYTNFARSDKTWYKFDDAWVTAVPEDHVLRSEAYLLFYIRRHLSYED